MKERRYLLMEVCEFLHTDQEFVLHTVRSHWIVPAEHSPVLFDEEDLARLRLIRELKEDFGVNDDAVPLILHLLDQIHGLRAQVGQLKRSA